MSELNIIEMGKVDGPVIVFAHGWDRTSEDFLPVAELIGESARTILIDLPGFGESPRPSKSWGTEEYAGFLRDYIVHELGHPRFIWVGHSFGGRIGLRMASMPNSPIDNLVVVAGAGIKRPRPWWNSLRARVLSRWFNFQRDRTGSEAELIELEKKYGSADYIHSRETGLRDIFVKTVNEDQTENVKAITCPTTLIYASKDTETPPIIGRMLNQLIPTSRYIECPEFDHSSILTRGRHQVALVLKEAISAEAL